MSLPRIPFEKIIGDRRLLKTAWGTFSKEQQAVMKFFYGLPIDPEEEAIWHALHGGGVYDDLYYLTGVHDSGVPYVEGREYTDITLCIGRRAAKSCIGHFTLCAEALCGGHKAKLAIKDQYPVFLHVSQDLGQAMSGMRQYSLYYLKSSPAGREMLGDLQKSVTQRSITLTDCGIVRVGPPNIKVGRGDSVACAVLDETAQWQSDEKSAAPDFEVERAIEYGMSQFSPYAKRIKLSTAYTESGLLWSDVQIGTHARHLNDPAQRAANQFKLVLHGPSPVLNNPTITKVFLNEKRAKDPEAFDREIGSKFSKSVAGYLSPALVKRAIDIGITKRDPQPGIYYVAAIDPAFKHDAFPLCIGHLGHQGEFIQDVLVSWRGSHDQPLDPSLILPLVGAELSRYRITNVMSDQYHLESLQSLAQDNDFLIEPFVLTAKVKNTIWRDTLTLLNQDKMRLLDHDELHRELLSLERLITANKTERIQGKRDDHAIVTAMCAHRALQFGLPAPVPEAISTETTPDGIAAVLRERAALARRPKPRITAWWNRR